VTEQDGYQIRVQGWIGERWANWFEGMTMVYEGAEDDSPITILTGSVVDQAALRGLLARIWDLNLTLISVTRNEE
jgi:voltage-gated potassium channel Kch